MNINPFIDLISLMLGLYSWVLIVSIVFSWLIAFGIVNPYSKFVSVVYGATVRLTEPLLRKIRAFLPNLGAIDISPIVVFLGISFIKSAMYTYLYTF